MNSVLLWALVSPTDRRPAAREFCSAVQQLPHVQHARAPRVSETISIEPTVQHTDVPAGKPACPVCGREAADGLVSFNDLPEDVRGIVAANAPGGALVSTICPRCVNLFQ